MRLIRLVKRLYEAHKGFYVDKRGVFHPILMSRRERYAYALHMWRTV